MDKTLSLEKYKAVGSDTARIGEISKHPYRSEFQRDRDRILYSREFRRLSGKTQVFITGADDHMRTRLTHTLEVAQIAETIAMRLELDPMLTVAIAYGHDVGHTPFGHVGERTLNFIMNGCFEYYGYNNKADLENSQKGFKHNLQGVRVTSFLEDPVDNAGKGLNLTRYTLWGIQNHTKRSYKVCEYCSQPGHRCRYRNDNRRCNGILSTGFYDSPQACNMPVFLDDRKDWTLEAVIVSYADEIAQRHHDIEDGILAGVLKIDLLCDFLCSISVYPESFHNEVKEVKSDYVSKKLSLNGVIKQLSRIIIDYYVTIYAETLAKKIYSLEKELVIDPSCSKWKEKIFKYAENKGKTLTQLFGFEGDEKKADDQLGEYLRDHILLSELAQSMDGKAAYIIKQLFKAYLTNPQQLPDKTIFSIIKDWKQNNPDGDEENEEYKTRESFARDKLKDLLKKDDEKIRIILLRRICDYIAGMTDRYAMDCYEKLYGTKGYM